jgi:hypothetical protein
MERANPMAVLLAALEKRTGKAVHPDTLYRARRRCRAGDEMSGLGSLLARDLEMVTGIDRRQWLYPGEFGDPFELWMLTN